MRIRTNHTTSLDDEMWYKLKVISVNKSKKQYTTLNVLLEEGMMYIIHKYKKYLPQDLQDKE